MYIIEERPSISYWRDLARYFGKRPDWEKLLTQYATKEKAEQQADIFRNKPKNAGILYRVVELNAA